jgi:hypothetical protein
MGCKRLHGSGGYSISLWRVQTSTLIVCVCVQSLTVAVSNLFLPPSPRVDKDRSGVISDTELQQALSNGNQRCLPRRPLSPYDFAFGFALLWLFLSYLLLPLFQLTAFLSLPLSHSLSLTLMLFIRLLLFLS